MATTTTTTIADSNKCPHVRTYDCFPPQKIRFKRGGKWKKVQSFEEEQSACARACWVAVPLDLVRRAGEEVTAAVNNSVGWGEVDAIGGVVVGELDRGGEAVVGEVGGGGGRGGGVAFFRCSFWLLPDYLSRWSWTLLRCCAFGFRRFW